MTIYDSEKILQLGVNILYLVLFSDQDTFGKIEYHRFVFFLDLFDFKALFKELFPMFA